MGSQLSKAQLAGIVVGGTVAALFVITCIISAVKAVRDRKRLKARIQAKKEKRERQQVQGSPNSEKDLLSHEVHNDENRANFSTNRTENQAIVASSEQTIEATVHPSSNGTSGYTKKCTVYVNDVAVNMEDTLSNGHCKAEVGNGVVDVEIPTTANGNGAIKENANNRPPGFEVASAKEVGNTSEHVAIKADHELGGDSEIGSPGQENRGFASGTE